MDWNRIWKKIGAGVMASVMCVNSVPAVSALADETAESSMGRYLETEVELPEGCFIRDAAGMADGTLRMIGQDDESGMMMMWDSSDGGNTWEQTAALPEEYADTYFLDIVLDAEGGGAGITMENSSSGEESGSGNRIDDYEYYLVSFDAEGNTKKSQLPDFTSHIRFTSGGELLNFDMGGGVSVLDRETGETVRTITDMQANCIGCCQNELLLVTDSEVQRINLESGEPLGRDDALNDALYAAGEDYHIESSWGFPIVFAQDEENRLYYCTNQGIFSHVMEGSVVEQIVDGTLSALSSPEMKFSGLIVQNQSFYVVYLDGSTGSNGMMKYEYAPDVPSVPEKELTIYSLEDNSAVRQAAVQFQKLYPDTFVNYKTGMSGDDGVTAADALRTLNTDILAGNGPDILVLDNMSVKTYAEKGLLEDLSGLVSEVQESDGLFENIVNAFQTGDTLPAVPGRFSLEAAAGVPELLERLDGLASLEALAEQPDVLDVSDIAVLPEVLYPVCAGSWKNEDNTINQEKLEEFVRGVKAISDKYRESASEKSLEALQNYTDALSFFHQWGFDLDGMGLGIISLYSGETKVKFGALGDYMNSYVGLMSVNHENGNCGTALLSMLQSDVFLPSCILGVLTTAKEQERAYDFVRYMLSEDGQSQNAGSGFPVNRRVFDTLLAEDQFGDGSGYGLSAGNDEGMVELTYSWPTEEEQANLKAMAEQVSVCADTELVQKETVIEETQRCIDGEISVEEAVNSIMQKMNLYLAE